MTVALPPPPQFGAPIELKPAPEVLRFLATRRSASAVTLGEPAPSDADLDVLLRLATRVPDHGKLAPWRFVILAGPNKAAFADRLEAIARARGDDQAAAKLAKLRIPPLCVAVVSSTREAAIPEWEQLLSAGAACTTLLYSALAMGYGANWITDWYAYDPESREVLGLAARERVAGYIMLGTAREPPLERERPDPDQLVTRWRPA
ncbi:MAG: nitroreductase [Phenylobacterium sp.]